MKKWTALCALLALVAMLGGAPAAAQAQENPLESFFRNVGSLLSGILDPNPTTGSTLKIDTLFQIHDENSVIDGAKNDLFPVDTDSLKASETVTIQGKNYAFWPRSSGATDKIISVKNTASEAAYFRTALLIKCSDTVWQNMALNRNTADYIWTDTSVSIGGESYPLLVATYTGSLAGKETSPPLLMQLAVDASVVGKLTTFSLEVNTFAIEAKAFGSKTFDQALDAAIPLENIAAAFGGTLVP